MFQEGAYILLYSLEDQKSFFMQLQKDIIFSTHFGNISHNQIMEKKYGEKIESHIHKPFLILRPSLYDILMNAKRHTQIIYPKDIGYILLKLGVRNGDRIIEAGTGSGVMTIALAYSVAPEGKVFSYEKREEFSLKAEKNLKLSGIKEYVDLKVRDVEKDGFDEIDADGIFLDMKNPSNSIGFAYESLKTGGSLALLLPTTNQISDALKIIEGFSFFNTEVLELMIRGYKVNAERLRPEDRMVGHTGYLIFTKKNIE